MHRISKALIIATVAVLMVAATALVATPDHVALAKGKGSNAFGKCNSAAAHEKDNATKLAKKNACREAAGKPLINETEAEDD